MLEARRMREIAQTSHFKSDLKKLARDGRHDVGEMLAVVEMLAGDRPLAEKFAGHPLFGECRGHRECHIRPDWLLIYRLEPGRLVLVRTGSHAELYNK
jgi:mRNA interferase YafQ